MFSSFLSCCDWNNPHPQSIKINGNNYKIFDIIGEGGFGFVYRGKDLSFGGGGRNARRCNTNTGNPNTANRESVNTNDDGKAIQVISGSQNQSLRRSNDMRVSTASSCNSESPYTDIYALLQTMNDAERKAYIAETRCDEVALKRFLLTEALTPLDRVRVLSETDHHRIASATFHKNIVRFIDSEVKHEGGRRFGGATASSSSASNNQSQQHQGGINGDATSTVAPPAYMDKASEVWIVMEICNGGSLQEMVNYNIKHGGNFSAEEVLSIALQCVAAVKHLHTNVSPPMSHWDIKLDNFLVAEELLRNVDVENTKLENSKKKSAKNSSRSQVGAGAVSSSATVNNSYVTSLQSAASFKSEIPQAITVRLCDFGASSQQYLQPTTAQEIAIAESELDAVMTLAYRAPETLDLWAVKQHNESVQPVAAKGGVPTATAAASATIASPAHKSYGATTSSSPSLSPFQRVDTKADIWSLGVVLYVLLFQAMPFDEGSKQSVLNATPKWTTPLPMWNRVDSSRLNIRARILSIVMNRMLVKNPLQRADIYEVCNLLCQVADDAKADNPHLTRSNSRPSGQEPQSSRF